MAIQHHNQKGREIDFPPEDMEIVQLDAANAGDLIPVEEVEAEAAARRGETRRRMAGGSGS